MTASEGLHSMITAAVVSYWTEKRKGSPAEASLGVRWCQIGNRTPPGEVAGSRALDRSSVPRMDLPSSGRTAAVASNRMTSISTVS